MYSLNKKEWICSLFKEWILEKSEFRVNLEWIWSEHLCYSLILEWPQGSLGIPEWSLFVFFCLESRLHFFIILLYFILHQTKCLPILLCPWTYTCPIYFVIFIIISNLLFCSLLSSVKGFNGFHGQKSRGMGDTPPPHDLEGGGHNIKCPPPPPRFWGCMIIHWNEDPFVMRGALRRGALSCLSERLVMYNGDPYSVSGKLTQEILRSGKSVGVPPPPPPPPGLARLSRLAADGEEKNKKKKLGVPPMTRFGFPPMMGT